MAVQIRGRVRDKNSGEGMPEVLVSNGEHVVKTGADGSYALRAEVGIHPFVWVSLPDGFRATERFYRTVPATDEQIDFALVPSPERGRSDFRLAQITDTHVEEEAGARSSREVLAQDLQELVEQARPDLIVHSGDLTNRGTPEELRCCRQAFETIATPVFPLFGNHDGSAELRAREDERTCTRNFGQVFGPAYYSFDWGGYHFVLYADVDGFFAAADKERKEAWLWADLGQEPAGRASVVVVHMPPPMDFVEQLARFNVRVVLYGHWHSSKAFVHAGVAVAATPPLCFGGIDTGARGYRLLEFSERGVELALRALQGPALQVEHPAAVSLGERDLLLRWKSEIPGELHRAAPVNWRDNILLSLRDEGVGEAGGVLCLDVATGEPRWQFHTGASVKNSVAVDGEARCVFVSAPGRVWAVDARSGSECWQVDLPGYPERWVHVAPALAEGTVYAGSKAGYGAYDLDTGKQRWYAPLDSLDAFPFHASPLVWEELLIVLQQGRGLLALQRCSGAIAWEQNLGTGYPYAAPVLAGDLLVSGGDEKCLAVFEAASGEMVWHREVLEEYPSGLAASGDRIFASTPGGRIQCFELHSGALCWQFQTGDDLLDMTPYRRGASSVLAAPVVWGERIAIGGNDGMLHVLDAASGACVSQTCFGAPVVASPCLVEEGICAGTWDGRVYCFSS